MYHVHIYTCDKCGDEIEIEPCFTAGKCRCGGTFFKSGEEYDQEFVDKERYERQQDEEYKERHRYDDYRY